MTNPSESHVVYTEDLEPSSSQVTAASNEDVRVVASSDRDEIPKPTPAPSPKGTANGKRQRTLFDVLGSAPSQGSDKPSKKPKLAGSGSGKTPAAAGTQSFGVGGSAGLQALNSIPFSSTEYTASLNEDQKRLLKLECETMGKSWLKVLKDEIKKPYFISLKEFLWKEGVRGPDDSEHDLKVYPAPRNIYSWSNYTPLGKVRVVMIGQDPYHGPGQAHGLCFSVPSGVPAPPSLKNIYAEIKAEYGDFVPPKHGNLTAWAEAGVLMLNTCLTVRARTAGSHQGKGWEQFTDRVVDAVDRYGGANLGEKSGVGRGVVFLAWGSWAAKRVAKLSKTKHLILSSAHPSPLSARKGFFGNGHFRKANDWLEERYGPDGRVDWCRLDPVI
ncbi:uracil-DNA glycosylase-like protein [Russula earlei]|uniref:Uracil-DNA glycosylase-like protein n=1 Tax=Russula earlei TaxID=71964 RepID=A0ACC0UN25_9AGAM|nr:uracil-DNA glycosylase-like protein [Russula earlei]